MKLHWQILIALALAVVVGIIFEADVGVGGFTLGAVFSFLGTLFLNALKMIVVPLVVSSVICGVYGLGSGDNLGRLGTRTIGVYLLSTLMAVLVGLVFVNITTPGIIDGEPAGERLNLSSTVELEESLAKIEDRNAGDIVGVFLRMIPTNVVEAAAQGELLGLIIFAILFGYFMTRVEQRYAETLYCFWQGTFEVMMAMTLLIMKFAPVGVFALVANTVMATGFDAFRPLLVFFFTVFAALAFHMFVVLAMLLRTLGGVRRPWQHYRAMLPALLTAFSTASSSATVPVTLRCLENNAGVSNKTTSFVIPLGATVNMDGTALYECVAAIFIAQAYGLDLTFAQQFLIVVMALLTSIGVAGIPAASLVAISVILTAIGLPMEGIALLLVTDRLLDMMRTAVNVFSDTCCTVIVARAQGEAVYAPAGAGKSASVAQP